MPQTAANARDPAIVAKGCRAAFLQLSHERADSLRDLLHHKHSRLA